MEKLLLLGALLIAAVFLYMGWWVFGRPVVVQLYHLPPGAVTVDSVLIKGCKVLSWRQEYEGLWVAYRTYAWWELVWLWFRRTYWQEGGVRWQ